MSKVWLVTGSGRGLGRHIVEAALAAGDRVVATARHLRQLADLRERHRDRVRPVALDVTDPAGVRGIIMVALDAFGRLDVLVNNAGLGHRVLFDEGFVPDFRAPIYPTFFR